MYSDSKTAVVRRTLVGWVKREVGSIAARVCIRMAYLMSNSHLISWPEKHCSSPQPTLSPHTVLTPLPLPPPFPPLSLYGKRRSSPYWLRCRTTGEHHLSGRLTAMVVSVFSNLSSISDLLIRQSRWACHGIRQPHEHLINALTTMLSFPST